MFFVQHLKGREIWIRHHCSTCKFSYLETWGWVDKNGLYWEHNNAICQQEEACGPPLSVCVTYMSVRIKMH